MTGGAESGLPRGNLISSLFRAGLDVDEQVGSCSSLQPPSSDSESRFAVSPVSRWMESGSCSQSMRAVHAAMCHRITVFLCVCILPERTEPSHCCWCCCWANQAAGGVLTYPPHTPLPSLPTDPSLPHQYPPVIASTRQYPAPRSWLQMWMVTDGVGVWCCAAGIRQYRTTPPPQPNPFHTYHHLTLSPHSTLLLSPSVTFSPLLQSASFLRIFSAYILQCIMSKGWVFPFIKTQSESKTWALKSHSQKNSISFIEEHVLASSK